MWQHALESSPESYCQSIGVVPAGESNYRAIRRSTITPVTFSLFAAADQDVDADYAVLVANT